MVRKPKLFYQRPVDSKTEYLKLNGDRYQIIHFLRTTTTGMKKRHTGGEIYSGDIAVIRRGGEKVEVILTERSDITELAADPPPPKKSFPRRRA